MIELERIKHLVNKAGLDFDKFRFIKEFVNSDTHIIIQLDDLVYTIRKEDALVVCIGKGV